MKSRKKQTFEHKKKKTENNKNPPTPLGGSGVWDLDSAGTESATKEHQLSKMRQVQKD